MRTIIFDVLLDGRFVMQHTHKDKIQHTFGVDMGAVLEEIYKKRPTLKGKKLELFETKNIVKERY